MPSISYANALVNTNSFSKTECAGMARSLATADMLLELRRHLIRYRSTERIPSMTEKLLGFFKAMADESRLRIVGLLAHRERSVQELAAALDLKEPTVSHHLAILRAQGLVTVRAKERRAGMCSTAMRSKSCPSGCCSRRAEGRRRAALTPPRTRSCRVLWMPGASSS